MRGMAMLGLAAALAAAGPAMGQGLQLPNLGGGGVPGLGGGAPGGGRPGGTESTAQALQGVFGQQTPEQKRAFCLRVANAARGCGLTLDATALTACVSRSLPAEDQLRVARVANSARGNATALLSECGVGR
jgi:hypothetical protein